MEKTPIRSAKASSKAVTTASNFAYLGIILLIVLALLSSNSIATPDLIACIIIVSYCLIINNYKNG